MWNSILLITIPAALVIAIAYMLIDKLLKNEEQRRNFELLKQNQPTIITIKLRAYERLMLLLERITPHSILLSKIEANMSVMELQNTLLNDIRKEFEHNYSQQIYISSDLWDAIRNAQENIFQLINLCSAKCDGEDSASTLATLIIQVYDSQQETALDFAKSKLKEEVSKILG